MASMDSILGAVITIAVAIIVIATVLAPTVAEYVGVDGPLAEYSGLLSAVIIMCIVGVLMVGVRLVSRRY